MEHILAFFLLGLFSFIGLFASVKVAGVEVRNPLVKMLITPFVFVLAGLFLIALGAILASPLILFYLDHYVLAVVVLALYLLIGLFADIRISGVQVHDPALKMFVGILTPAIFVMVGLVILCLGICLASPLLLLAF